MSSETPAIEGETTEKQTDETLGIIGIIAVSFRWAYNNPVIGFGMDMVGIGSLVFAGVIGIMLALVTLSGILGGWVGLYALFIAVFGSYGAYQKRRA